MHCYFSSRISLPFAKDNAVNVQNICSLPPLFNNIPDLTSSLYKNSRLIFAFLLSIFYNHIGIQMAHVCIINKFFQRKGERCMKFTFAHNNLNVYDLDKSLEFYKEALGLTVTRTKDADDGSFKLVYLGDGATPHLLELTWLRDMDRPYNLGDNEIHLAFTVDDFDAAYAKHKEMGCICYENPKMGIYFISDPDGYWLEIVPAKK